MGVNQTIRGQEVGPSTELQDHPQYQISRGTWEKGQGFQTNSPAGTIPSPGAEPSPGQLAYGIAAIMGWSWREGCTVAARDDDPGKEAVE